MDFLSSHFEPINRYAKSCLSKRATSACFFLSLISLLFSLGARFMSTNKRSMIWLSFFSKYSNKFAKNCFCSVRIKITNGTCPAVVTRKIFLFLKGTASSSVARAGYSLSTKLQSKKNTTFLALLRLFFALELTKK